VGYDQQSPRFGDTERQEARLASRVIGITERQRQRVSKYRRCFLESDTVLPTVRRCLDGVPLELHANILGRQDEPGKAWGNGAGALFEQTAEAACRTVIGKTVGEGPAKGARRALGVTRQPVIKVWIAERLERKVS